MDYTGDIESDIKSGRPAAYFDHIERTYSDGFKSGAIDAIETFALLYQQVSILGNKQSTDMFVDRFIPMLPLEARRKIVNKYLHETQTPPGKRS